MPDDRDLINLRDQVGEIERALELLHGDAKNGLDYTVAHQAELQSQRTYEMAVAAHRLNMLVATFFPLATLSTIFAAVYGMMLAHQDNHGMQEVSTPALFWCLMGFGLLCGLLLGKIVARKPPPIVKPAAKAKPKRRANRVPINWAASTACDHVAGKSTSNFRPNASAHLCSVASVGFSVLPVSSLERAGASIPMRSATSASVSPWLSRTDLKRAINAKIAVKLR